MKKRPPVIWRPLAVFCRKTLSLGYCIRIDFKRLFYSSSAACTSNSNSKIEMAALAIWVPGPNTPTTPAS